MTLYYPEQDMEAVEGIETRSKRKGSPLSKDEGKRQVGALRRQSSLPNILKTFSDKKKEKPMSFSDMIKVTFNDKSFTDSIAPVLYDMISPLIQETIQTTVTAAINSLKTTCVDPIIEANSELRGLIESQHKTIAKQGKLIDDQKKIIVDQRELIDSKSDSIEELQGEVSYLMTEMNALKLNFNELEQYGRRNSLRFVNMKLPEPTTDNRDDRERDLTIFMVNFINKAVFKGLGQPLTERDIERCHTMGRPNKFGAKQVLVKFRRYHDKRRVFISKSSLKGNPNKSFIAEDLTSVNHSQVKNLLPLKKSTKIHSFWTSDGRIYAKKEEGSTPIRILPNDDVYNKLVIERQIQSDASESEPIAVD